MLATWLEARVLWFLSAPAGDHELQVVRNKTMTNRTAALGRRIIGALRNENVVVVVSTSLHSVTLLNAKTGKAFYTASTLSTEHQAEMFVLLAAIKAAPGYPAPKERKVYGTPRVRHTATTAVNMGRFVPGNVSF